MACVFLINQEKTQKKKNNSDQFERHSVFRKSMFEGSIYYDHCEYFKRWFFSNFIHTLHNIIFLYWLPFQIISFIKNCLDQTKICFKIDMHEKNTSELKNKRLKNV